MKIYTIIIFSFLSLFPQILRAEDAINEHISRMSLKEQIGQLIIVGFKGKDISPEDIKHIKKINPGGFAFYRRNFKDANDIATLISKIQSIFKNERLPHFFVIDQEGGIVHRVESELYKPPSEPSIGAADSEKLARKVGFSIGNALRYLGININLAPVLDMPADIISSPITMRSFGNNVGRVEQLGVSYIQGIKEAGLLATAKHFPGIGRAHEDSHLMLPHVFWKSQAEREKDLRPFKSAIKAAVDVIMMGHFIAEPGDSKNPVSLSSYWMSDVLRKEMGFNGLILIDNIEMKAIEDVMPIPKAAVQSFKAGADLIMVNHERKNQEEVFNALIDAVEKGEITTKRIGESLRRIIEAKIKIMSYNIDKKSDTVNLRDVSRITAEKSIVVLQQKDYPFHPVRRESDVLYAGYNFTFYANIKSSFLHTEILNMPPPASTNIGSETSTRQFLKRFDAVIIDADYHEAQAIISLCNDLNIKYILVLCHPRNIQETLEKLSPQQIAVPFENSEIYFQAIVDIIRGIKQPRGRLPYEVKLPADYVY